MANAPLSDIPVEAGSAAASGAWSSPFSDEELDLLYGIAHGMYTRRAYESAEAYFGFLLMHSPGSERFLKGLAASQLMGGRHVAAAASYSLLVLRTGGAAEAMYLYGHALLLSGEFDEAGTSLRAVCASEPANGAWAAKAKALLELIEA